MSRNAGNGENSGFWRNSAKSPTPRPSGDISPNPQPLPLPAFLDVSHYIATSFPGLFVRPLLEGEKPWERVWLHWALFPATCFPMALQDNLHANLNNVTALGWITWESTQHEPLPTFQELYLS